MLFEHGYALIIGVGEIAKYTDWSLPMTVNDAKSLKALLVNPSLCAYPDDAQHIRLLHDSTATRQRILDELDWLATCALNDPEATIIVFYSGHGWVDKTTGQYYLIQHDVRPGNLAGTCLAAQTMIEKLRAIAAQRLLVIFDCCHAQGMATSKGVEEQLDLPANIHIEAMPKEVITDLKDGKGRAVFTSSLGDQLSWTHDKTISLYTYHLLEALQGAGNKLHDTVVRLSNLMNHLGTAVPASAQAMGKVQTPFFDTASEDFPVALLQGGKGLEKSGWVDVAPSAEATIVRIVQTTGDRGVAAAGDIKDSTIITGNNNTLNQGKYNIQADTMTGAAIGDNARVTNVDARGSQGYIQNAQNMKQDFSQRTIHTGGGDYAGRDMQKGTVNDSSGIRPQIGADALVPTGLQSILEQAHSIESRLQQNEELNDGLQIVIIHLNAALRAEEKGDHTARQAKIHNAQGAIADIAHRSTELTTLQYMINLLQ